MRIILAAGIAFFLSVSTASAAADCSDRANQAEINECAMKAGQGAEAAMMTDYNALMKLLSDSDQKLLREAQQQWMAFRDAECIFRTVAYKDGSIYWMLVSNCFEELNQERDAQLKYQLDCGEFDLCAPHPNAP